MKPVVYLYFATPTTEGLRAVLASIASQVSVSHFGTRDPPPRWSGTLEEMEAEVMRESRTNKTALIRDATKRIEISLHLHFDPRWTFSTVSADAPSVETLDRFAVGLIPLLNPYLAIQGELGLGKNQSWRVLTKRSDCPPELAGVVA